MLINVKRSSPTFSSANAPATARERLIKVYFRPAGVGAHARNLANLRHIRDFLPCIPDLEISHHRITDQRIVSWLFLCLGLSPPDRMVSGEARLIVTAFHNPGQRKRLDADDVTLDDWRSFQTWLASEEWAAAAMNEVQHLWWRLSVLEEVQSPGQPDAARWAYRSQRGRL